MKPPSLELQQTLAALQKRRALVFYPALLLSALAVFRRSGMLSMGCGLLWVLAGGLCLMEARTLGKMGLKAGATAIHGVLYIAIGALLAMRR